MHLFGRKRIYMDYAGATPVCREAAHAHARALALYGNPGALHKEGGEALASLDTSREAVALFLGCKARHIIFTSGATEANNLALLGHARHLEQVRRTLEGTHWLISSIEHPSVLETAGEIERLGGTVSYIEPDGRGLISVEALRQALRGETVCVSVGWGNSEIGVVQPLAKLAKVVREHEAKHGTRVLFHSDAGQAPLYLASTAHSLGVDVLTLDSAKLSGPHGIGALYIGSGTELRPILFGGAQERGLRPGTENVALAAGFAAALAAVATTRERETKRLQQLRDSFVSLVREGLPEALINGDLGHALPHIANISVPGIQSEYVTLALDSRGIAISTKSACREGEERESHVVRALGGEQWRAGATLRFSLGAGSTTADVQKAAASLIDIVRHLPTKSAVERP